MLLVVSPAVANHGTTLVGSAVDPAARVAYQAVRINAGTWSLTYTGSTAGNCEAIGTVETGLRCTQGDFTIGGTGHEHPLITGPHVDRVTVVTGFRSVPVNQMTLGPQSPISIT